MSDKKVRESQEPSGPGMKAAARKDWRGECGLQGEVPMQFPCMSHGKTLNCHSEFHLLHTSALSEKQIRKKLREIFRFPFLNVYRRVEQ